MMLSFEDRFTWKLKFLFEMQPIQHRMLNQIRFYRVPQSKFEAKKSVIEYNFFRSVGLKTKYMIIL